MKIKTWLIVALCLAGTAFAEQIKDLKPTGFVNDYANIIPDSQQQELEAKLQTVAAQGKAQISVVIIQTTDGEDIEGYSMAVASSWGIGESGKDNGLLFLTAVKDRKMRFEVGYGLEGALNDAKCGRIMDRYVIPQFRNGDYVGGIIAGVDGIIAQLEEPVPVSTDNQVSMVFIIIVAGICLFIVLVVVLRKPYTPYKSHSSSPFGGSHFGGFGGGHFGGGGSSRGW